MTQIPEFSLVIFPTPEQLDLVKSLKQLLKSHIGWFGSANAAGHITVIQFDTEFELSLYIESIREFCKTQKPTTVIFNHFDSFGERTFFIAPDEKSQEYLDMFIKNLHQALGFKIKEAHAHISIARGLDADRMRKAYELFHNTEAYLEFNCKAIYVRKFNHETKQYSEIVEKIDFEGLNI